MNWAKFRELVTHTAARLKAAGGDAEGIDAAIRRYIQRGDKMGMSPLVLWDYFAISSPGIPEQAGCRGAESERRVALFGKLMNERFSGE